MSVKAPSIVVVYMEAKRFAKLDYGKTLNECSPDEYRAAWRSARDWLEDMRSDGESDEDREL